MKAALLIVLSLSAMALAGPAFTKNNQIDSQESQYKQQQQQLSYRDQQSYTEAKGPIVDILKQWCFSSQMSQQELTASFKKLVGVVKSNPVDQTTEQAVMSERICSGVSSTNLIGKQQQTATADKQQGADAQAHELIKDVYMDALIACKSRECTQQLLKIIQQQSDKVDNIRASYYMTRLAVTEKDQIKSVEEIKQLVESFVQQQQQQSELIERQKLFAVTSMVGKYLNDKPTDGQAKQIAQQVIKTIEERYLRPVVQRDIEQYKQEQDKQQVSEELVKKIAKRNVALKALANLPGHLLKEVPSCQQQLVSIVQNKQELVSSRQSAIECLEQNDQVEEMLKKVCFDQEEPIEVRIAAYRALITVVYSVESQKNEQQKQQQASKIIDELVKHCEDQRNQEEDDQFVLYVISHLDNISSSQQPEHQAIKECIMKNKQHYMQVQVLCKKFKQQLSDIRRSSRNYKLEQEFNQIESGLIIEGDLIYESKQGANKRQQEREMVQVLPKLVRVNMSMPVMGETVNVVEITLRQNQMDEEILSTLKLVQNTKFNSQSVSKVVDSFKSSIEKQQQKSTGDKKEACEADLTIKVDGCTIVYLTIDDFKTSSISKQQQGFFQSQQHKRQTRSVYSHNSIVDDLIDYLKRQPINFNRGFNFNLNERIAKLLDVEANLIAGLRFESRAQGHSSDNFEIVAKMEPRFNFETIVGPAKMSSKKLLQRLSTKTAVGLRLRFKRDELVDVQIDLPMQKMELFTVESQIIEKSSKTNSYNYLPESIYGDEDIYTAKALVYPSEDNKYLTKRSIFDTKEESMIKKIFKGKTVQRSLETSDKFARTTGLRGLVRLVAAPKDMSFIVQCLVTKYEPSMEGYRVQIQKSQSSGQQQKTYLVQVSTPGSRINRQMQMSFVKQSSAQRTILKSEVQMGDKLAATYMTEIVHDGRQYSVKTEIVSRTSPKQWRHFAEVGLLVVGKSQQVGRSTIGQQQAFAYKPFVQVESTYLKRPLQLQGTISYQQSPKSVIIYELKCPTSGDFIQGKLIVEQRDHAMLANKRHYQQQKSMAQSYRRLRRSMQSPLELVLSKDLTLTSEVVAQVQEHAIKVHNMIDWDAQKISLQTDSSCSYKNTRKSQAATTVSAQVKLDTEQQVVVVERKSPEEQRKEYRALVKSEWRAPSSHQMLAELRYNGRRESMVAYKHKIDINKIGSQQYDCRMEMELIDTERRLSEKFVGRTRVTSERKQKQIQLDLANLARQQQCKLSFDFESLKQHQLELFVKTQEFEHKCELRNNQRQFVVVSRTEKRGQTLAKLLVEMDKRSPAKDCKVAFECPMKRTSLAADIKLASGQRSSMAIQTPRFTSSGEFTFETVSRPFMNAMPAWLSPRKSANLRFRNQIKDLQLKEQYWMDSALNAANWDKDASYFRFESPVYRTDVEFDPRDYSTKVGAFARSKRSSSSADYYATSEQDIYSTKNSALSNFVSSHSSTVGELAKQLNQIAGTPNKMWMLRALIASPFARDQLKQQARRTLLQYIDQEQLHKHSFEYNPRDSSFQFDFDRSPNTLFGQQPSVQPVRVKADYSLERPITVSLDSDWMSAQMETKPFDDEESYARISALSRHRRSPFKSHESEWRHKKDEGHKAWMKHVDSKDKRHELRAESERSPKQWSKVQYESDKHGKANWEHKWRKHAEKKRRSSEQEAANDEQEQEVFNNQVRFSLEGPAHKPWMHETEFDWQEPSKMSKERRHRRSVVDETSLLGRYSPIDYLKHTSARLSSSQYAVRPIQGQVVEPLYKVDFDYKPQLAAARLDVQMPEEMLHSSSFEMKPEERVYKLHSKLYNRRSQEPIYDLSAQTKPYVASLATQDQEPVFVHSDHPMLERPIDTESVVYNMFKQPMKLDYSDKYGRQASFDYDQLPIESTKYQGLRQKRAAVFYKDSDNDFEHTSSYDFYPEQFLGRMKPEYYSQIGNKNSRFGSEQQKFNKRPVFNSMDDVVIKSQTKYGPVVVRADTSDVDNMQCELESPIVNVKLTAETGANLRKLIKFHLDNKSQRVQLQKLIRKLPESLRQLQIVDKAARKIDSSRFEHDTELLVSLVDSIFKIKSQTELNSRKLVVIDGEWNQQQGKAFAKINGERCDGKLVIDLIRKQVDLVLDATLGKHQEVPVKHTSRLVRSSDNFYTLESTTSYKSRPLFKLVGKVSSLIFEEPAHFFSASRRHQHSSHEESQHVSTFEAVVYEPKEYHITAVYDCEKKEARLVCKGEEENKIQETIVKYDDSTESIIFNSRLSSPYEGQIYTTKAKLNLPGLFQDSYKCQAVQHKDNYNRRYNTTFSTITSTNNKCSSELIYEDKQGVWAAKYQPSEYVAISTPRGQQTFKLNNQYYY